MGNIIQCKNWGGGGGVAEKYVRCKVVIVVNAPWVECKLDSPPTPHLKSINQPHMLNLLLHIFGEQI